MWRYSNLTPETICRSSLLLIFVLAISLFTFLPAKAQTGENWGSDQGTNHFQPALIEANVDQVVDQYGLSGAGTVFVMIDDGCDYRHPDFIDDQGNTRIAFLYDMLNPAGENDPENPYGVGTIFDANDINASLQAGGAPIAEEKHGHGTATTGIGVGNGSGTSNRQFRGVAVDPTIIVIKAYTRSFPGQIGVFSEANIITAVKFAADKIEELGLPGVAVVNAGRQSQAEGSRPVRVQDVSQE